MGLFDTVRCEYPLPDVRHQDLESIRKFAAEMAGPRRQEAEEFYRSFGVVRESWHYQETPHGPQVIGVTEIDGESSARAQAYADSIPTSSPPSEVIFDTQGGIWRIQ